MAEWSEDPDVRIRVEDAGIGIKAASGAAGQYLESIGVFDLRQLSKEQWRTFLEVVLGHGLSAMAGALQARMEAAIRELDEIPY